MSDLDNKEYEATKSLKEKSADEMLEELGYTNREVTPEFIFYSKKEIRYGSQREWEICIDFNCYDKYLITKNKQYFCLEELQAINKKCKELRMDIITIPEPNMNKNEIKFGIAIQNAILNGKCEKCKYLKQCENNKDFKFPNDSWCFNKYKEIMFK